MTSDATTVPWSRTWREFFARGRDLSTEADTPVLPEPTIWENAAELLAQEFQPLPRETRARLR